MNDKGFIEPAPKGAENPKARNLGDHLKRYPTTYKQEYIEPVNQGVNYSVYAGKPLAYTPIGQL